MDGPLILPNGDVVGINTVKITSAEGIGFAVPINVIKPKYVDEQTLNFVKNEAGFVGVASNLVQFDKEYENVILNVLGNILVTTKIEDALNISKKINSRYRIVTLDGEIVHVGGSLTGGSKSASSITNEKTTLDNIIKDINVISTDIANKEKDLKEFEEKLNKLQSEIYQVNLELVKKKESNSLYLSNIEKSKAELDKVIDEIHDLSNSSDDSSSILDGVLSQYYEVEKNKKLLENEMVNLEKDRKNIIETIEDKEQSSKVFESKYKEISDRINSLEVNEAKLNMNLDNLLNRLNEEYGMTYEKARNNYTLTMDIEEARNLISDLKRSIKSLGEVNLGSIDEYERVNKRYSYLVSQKDDLKASEDNLLNIIRDMDDVMIDKFATTFKKINTEFGKVFKDLFGGGEAYLEMTDPTNVLETGIEIIAHPAGKKPGVISLLSGGEKTLTAISLLFAIMNLKSVPFVILDEVESALDEVNVDKFGRYIKSYKGKTQLLVITHKKKTMEYLDLLYGITMQEGGVSKLVSVKLEEIES